MREDRHWQWLNTRITEWVGRGDLSPAEGEKILRLRPAGDGAAQKQILAVRILFAFSAVLLGLGVISLVAYNWNDMPRLLRMAIVLVPMGAAHTAGLLCRRSGRRTGLAEFLHLLGSLLLGAAIGLCVQMYNIDLYFADGFLLWALGCAVMAYALGGSTSQLILFTVTSLVWVTGVWGRYPGHGAPGTELTLWMWGAIALNCAVSLPAAARSGKAAQAAAAFAACSYPMVLMLGRAPAGLFGPSLLMAFFWIGAGLAFKKLGWENLAFVFRRLGLLAYLPALLALTFADAIKGEIMILRNAQETAWLFPALLLGLGAALWGWGLKDRFRAPIAAPGFPDHGFFVPLTGAVLAVAVPAGAGAVDPANYALAGAAAFNVVAASHALVLIFWGSQTKSAFKATAGSVLIAAVIFFRFLSVTDSFLVRALVFIALGAALMTFTLRLARKFR